MRFNNDCSHLPLRRIASDQNLSIHERTEKLNQLIISIVDKHAPEKTVRVRCKKNQWLTPERQRLITLRNKYYNQVFKSAHSLTDAQIEQYKKFRIYVTNQIRAAKKNFISRSLSESDKSFYSCLKSMTKKGKSETTIEQIVYNNTTYKDRIDIASALNEFFVKVGGQSEFDPTKHKSQPVANQQTVAFSRITSKTVTLLIKSLKPDKRGGLSGMPAMIYKVLVDLISYPLAILINECYDTSIFPAV